MRANAYDTGSLAGIRPVLTRFMKEVNAALRPGYVSRTVAQSLRAADFLFERRDDRIETHQIGEPLVVHLRHLSGPFPRGAS
jgi:hypothetical protein